MKNIAELLPLILLLLLSMGVYYLNEFYRKFNIKIAAYTSLSDLPSLLVDFYYSIIGLLIALVLVGWVFLVEAIEFLPPTILEKLEKNRETHLVDLLLAVSLIVLSAYLAQKKAQIDFNKIIEKGPESDVVLTSEDFNIDSASKLNGSGVSILIGQTKECLFFYNRDTKETVVVKSEKIKTIKFRSYQKPVIPAKIITAKKP